MAVTVVQTAANAATGATVAASFGTAPTAGNTVLAFVGSDNTFTVTAGGTRRFTFLSDQQYDIWEWTGSLPTTVTVTPTAADYVSVVLVEISGGAFDVVGTVASTTSATSIAASTITTTAANDLVLVSSSIHGQTISPCASPTYTNGFTAGAAATTTALSTAACEMFVGSKTQATAGAVGSTTVGWTNRADNISAVQIAYKASTGTAYTSSPADAEGITDTVSSTVSYVRTVSDTVGITDAAGAGAQYGGAPTDPAGITDAVTTAVAYDRQIDDAVGITDTGSPITVDVSWLVSDPVGLSDVATTQAADTRVSTDPAGITDVLTTVVAAGRAADEPVGMTDSVTAALDRVVAIADQIGATDAATPTLAGGTASVLGDAASLRDTVTVTIDRAVLIEDGIGATDSVSTSVAFCRVLVDQIGGTDQSTGSNPGAWRDITVTATLDPRRWAATLADRRWSGAVQPRRWKGTLL